MHDIKRRLKQLRQEKNLTMSEFAKLISVSPGNVGDWESESRTSIPGAKALISIATIFDVSLDWILLGHKSTPLDEKQQNSSLDQQTIPSLIELIHTLSSEDKQLIATLAKRLYLLSHRQ
ncbi:helix-turn-helix domain-containing protein [Paenibacillus sp. FJAT-27812]|uniref:helix-turn-helix domain-containing protein n=1 Tax=Paenibacillus sp. FJAT-27812 TaxID=1684143 RepID=UPI0006A7B257|nr:helix-turn-helix transcriptional regulator [Paenibacillus sp. FJAT-27812]